MATHFYKTPDFSPQAGVVTQRPSSTALLTIDSEDRFKDYNTARIVLTDSNAPNNSPYDFTIVKNESIMNGFFTRLGLTEVVFPWAIPNINAKTRQIIVSYGGTNAILTLSSQFVKPFDLAAKIQAAVRTISSGLSAFTMTYGIAPSQEFPAFQYSNAALPMSFSPMPYNTTAYPYGSQTKQLFDVLGFTSANKIDSSGAVVGTYTLAQATRYVDIVCSQLVYNQNLKDTTTQTVARDSLCRLYVGDANGFGANMSYPSSSNFTPPGTVPSVIYRQFQTPKMINWTPNQPVGNLRFQVYDDAGAILTESVAGSGISIPTDYLNWSSTILVSEN